LWLDDELLEHPAVTQAKSATETVIHHRVDTAGRVRRSPGWVTAAGDRP
jgi:hypothetical protein